MRVPCASPLGGLSILNSRQCGELKHSPHRRAARFCLPFLTQRRPATSSAPFLPMPPDSDNFSAPSISVSNLAQTWTSINRPRTFHNRNKNMLLFDEDNGTKKAKVNGPPTVLNSDAQGWTSMASMTRAKSLSTRQTQQPISMHFSSLSPVCGVTGHQSTQTTHELHSVFVSNI